MKHYEQPDHPPSDFGAEATIKAQREHIDRLTSDKARLAAELAHMELSRGMWETAAKNIGLESCAAQAALRAMVAAAEKDCVFRTSNGEHPALREARALLTSLETKGEQNGN